MTKARNKDGQNMREGSKLLWRCRKIRTISVTPAKQMLSIFSAP
jgi:hypothetical protein